MPQSEFARFVGMESDDCLARVFVPASRMIRMTRVADVHFIRNAPLTSVLSLGDGLSRHRDILEQEKEVSTEDAEDDLQAYIVAMLFEDMGPPSISALPSRLVPHHSYEGISDGPQRSPSLKSA